MSFKGVGRGEEGLASLFPSRTRGLGLAPPMSQCHKLGHKTRKQQLLEQTRWGRDTEGDVWARGSDHLLLMGPVQLAGVRHNTQLWEHYLTTKGTVCVLV